MGRDGGWLTQCEALFLECTCETEPQRGQPKLWPQSPNHCPQSFLGLWLRSSKAPHFQAPFPAPSL